MSLLKKIIRKAQGKTLCPLSDSTTSSVLTNNVSCNQCKRVDYHNCSEYISAGITVRTISTKMDNGEIGGFY